MKRTILCSALLALPAAVQGALSLGVSTDVVHENKSHAISIESSSDGIAWTAGLMFYTPEDDDATRFRIPGPEVKPGVIPFYGVTKEWSYKYATVGFGGVYLGRYTPSTGTKLNFLFTLKIPLSKTSAICFKHISHGSMVGIEKDKPNAGLNFLGLCVE